MRYASTQRKETSSVNMQTRRWCGQDHATISVESSTSSDRQRRRPDVCRNSVESWVLHQTWGFRGSAI